MAYSNQGIGKGKAVLLTDGNFCGTIHTPNDGKINEKMKQPYSRMFIEWAPQQPPLTHHLLPHHHPHLPILHLSSQIDGLKQPMGLTVDWVNEKLYWTDTKTDKIEMSNLDGTMRTTIVEDDMDVPHAIAVDPISKCAISILSSDLASLKHYFWKVSTNNAFRITLQLL